MIEVVVRKYNFFYKTRIIVKKYDHEAADTCIGDDVTTIAANTRTLALRVYLFRLFGFYRCFIFLLPTLAISFRYFLDQTIFHVYSSLLI